MVAKQGHVLVERTAGVVGRKPRVHLFIGQPLQRLRRATHQSGLRHVRKVVVGLFGAEWLRGGLGGTSKLASEGPPP